MELTAIWRYPVKSLAGEQVEMARVGPGGVEGDRVAHLAVGETVISARARPRLLGLQGGLDDDGRPTVDGHDVAGQAAAELVRQAVHADAIERTNGAPVRLVETSAGRFDVLPILLLTDGALTAAGLDQRRLRPNLVVSGAPWPLERDWVGRRLAVGDIVIEAMRARPRCVVVTVDPDDLRRDHDVLRGLVDRFDGCLGLDCAVVTGGTVRVGDPVGVL